MAGHGQLHEGYGRFVNFETDPGSESDPQDEFRNLVQDAVDRTAAAYREQGIGDVMDRLRSELSDRGVEISDDAWLSEVAGMIRARLPLVVGVVEGLTTAPEEGRHRASD